MTLRNTVSRMSGRFLMPTKRTSFCHHRSVQVLLAFILSALSLRGADSYERVIQPFMEKYCLACHGAKKQKGDLRIDTLSREFKGGLDTELWAEIMGRMNSGEMPPEDEAQPSPAETGRIVGWINDRIREGEAARMAARPPVAHYRLSRDEYAHTVYDLLGVVFDPRAPGAFTEDPRWHGFERIGSELSLSPSHIEKYLKAAEEIIDQAFPDVPPRQIKTHRRAIDIDWNNREKEPQLREIGVLDHIRTLIWPGHKLTYLRPDSNHRQNAGIYRGRIKLSGLTPKGGRPPHLILFSKKLDRTLFETDVLAPEHEPTVFEFETFLPAGAFDVTIDNSVPGPSNAGRQGRPGGFVFTTLDDPKSRAPWQRKMTDDEGNPLYPFLIFDWMEWEGPIVKPEDVAKREGLFPHDADTVNACLKRFAERAWRRPVTDRELDRYRNIFAAQQAAGVEFRRAYKSALVGIMASKNFTYIAEGDAEARRNHLNGPELASRLSYFLWSSLPDTELTRAAKAGELANPAGLRKQLSRMVADSKIGRFTESFPQQWLQLAKVGMFPPDEKLYPDYDQWLEQSMINETREYFAAMFRENLPLREFLDSNWTMLNPRLAHHYELPIPATAGFQRVSLPANAHRGGIMTHGSVLSLTSDGTRHRPVHRGIWVSEVLLGIVPPPPPPNVDAIEPNPVNEPKATIRQKLEAHVANPNCASCHAKIDPLGFAFDNYDAVGRWRTEEFVPKGRGQNPPVDASGRLPDGRPFDGPEHFKELLAANEDAFVRAFVEKLANYALRRAMTVDDRDQLDAIVTTTKPNQHRLQTVIEAFVTSELFLKR